MAVRMHTCRSCGKEFEVTRGRCPACKVWMPDDNVDGYGSVLLEDIQSADVDRIQTGPWDICFGANDSGEAGVVRGSTNLIAGAPGGGKSTMFLQLCENVIKKYDIGALYLSAEEQLKQIKARAVRLGINGRRQLRFIDLRKGNVDLMAVLKSFKFGILIVDSLKAISPDEEGRVEVCKVVKNFGVDLNAPVIISHHVNKGEDIAGLMALQHEVDCTMTLFPDETRKYKNEAIRTLQVRKNRNGQAWIEAEFGMTGLGLVPIKDIEGEIVKDDGPTEEDDRDARRGRGDDDGGGESEPPGEEPRPRRRRRRL